MSFSEVIAQEKGKVRAKRKAASEVGVHVTPAGLQLISSHKYYTLYHILVDFYFPVTVMSHCLSATICVPFIRRPGRDGSSNEIPCSRYAHFCYSMPSDLCQNPAYGHQTASYIYTQPG
jgi:hypothetical protein